MSSHTGFRTPKDDSCAPLNTPDGWNFALSLFILIGLVVSYLPQHVRIVRRRSSEGISPYFVLLGTTSATCALANVLALPASRADLACCRVISGFGCFAGALGVIQIATQWVCFSIIMLLFLIYFPTEPSPALTASPAPHAPPATTTYRGAVIIVALCVAHALLTALANCLLSLLRPSALQPYAHAQGILAAALATLQYLPQLYTTARLRAAASLSIPMMCLQTPGAFVWAASLAARLGWAGWSTWGVYVVTGCLQGALLCMAVVFEVRRRRFGAVVLDQGRAFGRAEAPGDEGAGAGEARGRAGGERTPLLRSEG